MTFTKIELISFAKFVTNLNKIKNSPQNFKIHLRYSCYKEIGRFLIILVSSFVQKNENS